MKFCKEFYDYASIFFFHENQCAQDIAKTKGKKFEQYTLYMKLDENIFNFQYSIS